MLVDQPMKLERLQQSARSLTLWRSRMQRAAPGSDVDSAAKDFHGELIGFDLAGARLWMLHSCTQRIFRKSECPGGRFAPMAIVALEGYARISQNGRECTLSPDSFTFIDSAKPLTLDYLTNFRHLTIQFPKTAFVRDAFQAAVACNVQERSALDGTFLDCAKNLWDRAPSLHPLKHNSALCSLASLANLTTPLSAAGERIVTPARVTRAMAYIEHNLGEPMLDAQTVADSQQVSRRYLDELFAKCGHRVDSWIWERRLERAAEHLSLYGLSRSRSRETILQVALDLGFKSPSHFSRVFAKRFGVSPNQYRKQHLARAVHPTHRRPLAHAGGAAGRFEERALRMGGKMPKYVNSSVQLVVPGE